MVKLNFVNYFAGYHCQGQMVSHFLAFFSIIEAGKFLKQLLRKGN